MLKLKVKVVDDFDEAKNEFIQEFVDLELEHSLASLSKWEMIWEVPLLSTSDKTDAMNLSYLECMCVTPNIATEVFLKLDEEQQEQISAYIDKQQTATWFSNEQPQAKSGEVITAELVYFWMSSFRIDWQAQYWPLNKLLTLIKVFSVKQDNKPQTTSRRNRQMEIARINAQRRKELGTNG